MPILSLEILVARKRTYEKLEKSITHKVAKNLLFMFKSMHRGFSNFIKLCDSKLTIMIVPHSQTNVINFRTNIFSLVFGLIIVVGMLFSFFYFNRQHSISTTEISRLQEENTKTLASFDILKDENNSLLHAAEKFRNTLNESLALMGIEVATTNRSSTGDSDLSSLMDNQTIASGTTREIAEVKQLTSYIESSIEPIEQIGEVIKSQQAIFSDTPNIWPLKGGAGRATHQFGHAIHPITGQWYIHTGFDIATGRVGDPIVSTANGKVITSTYSDSLGIHVAIQHKYGYITRYAHMNASYVSIGQEVEQGEVIGVVGNTGISTGPHLHYEIYIGSSLIDPARYVNIKSIK